MIHLNDKEEARLRAKFMSLVVHGEQAPVADDDSTPPTIDTSVDTLVSQANLRTGVRDLIVLTVSSFQALLVMMAGRRNETGAKPNVGED